MSEKQLGCQNIDLLMDIIYDKFWNVDEKMSVKNK